MLRWLRIRISTLGLAWTIAAPGAPAAAQPGTALPAVPPAAITPADPVPRGQIRFRSFGAAEGLHNLVVWSLAQDRAGMLWVGTDDGVYRYDGLRFIHFSVQDGLRSTAVNVLGIAPDGEVCAGGTEGLVCWNPTTHRFDATSTAGLPITEIRGIALRSTQLWVATRTGLYVRQGTAPFVPAPGWPGGNAPVSALWADADGVIAASGSQIAHGDGRGSWGAGAEDLGTGSIDGVARDHAGTIWIRTAAKMWAWAPAQQRLRDLTENLPSSHEIATRVAPITVSAAGEVWLGTDHGIAYRRGDRWHLVQHDAGFPAAQTRSILIDQEGTTWVGAVGLFQWLGRGIVERYDQPSGLPGDVVWSMGRDLQGQLWIGTDRCLARAVDGAWQCQAHTSQRIVRAAVFLPDGGTFLGGAPGDLWYIAPDGSTISLKPEPFEAEQYILSLALDGSGDLWIGTRTGLYRLAGAKPGPLEAIVIPDFGAQTRVTQLSYASGRLWAVTERGLAIREAGRWRVFDTHHGLHSNDLRYIVRRADGRICVSYSEAIGLTCFRYDGERLGELEHIGEPDGLSAGMVYFLGEDRAGRLWVGTGDGVDVIAARGIDHFGQVDGLAGNDCAATAFFADTDGTVWLGATGGISHIQVPHYLGPPPAPRTIITTGRLGGQAIRASAQHRTRAGHDASSLLVEFAAGSFLDPDRLEFQSWLSPAEHGWTTNPTREVRAPALPPGSYVLQVRARLGSGAWGPTAELRFEVLAAWWQTRWILAVLIGAALGVLAVAFAWRYRRRTLQLISRADASFRAHVDSIPDVIAVYRDAQLVHLNAAASVFFGAHVDLRDRVHEHDRAVLMKLVTHTAVVDPARRAEVIEVRLCAADGSWRLCEVSSLRLSYGGGPVMVVSGRDVTERQQLRAQLLISDRMASLGTLAAGIAHEINNPLSYVYGNLEVVIELLLGEGRLSDADRQDAAAALGDAREGALRVKKIVQELRSFNRCQDERRAPVVLATVIEGAIKLTLNEIRHRAQLIVELGAAPQVLADEGRLTQVLINLLVNAAQAVPPGHANEHRIIARTRTDTRGHAVVEVEDSGPGMTPDVRARAFDPFFTTKDVGQGTGLGLSICHTIVSAHGGQISTETGSLGGCLVRVTLPPDESGASAAAPPTTTTPTPAAPVRRRVLLVDDDPMVTKVLERMLARDHDLRVASSGELAVRWIADGARFDIIISDVMMPTMSGPDLLDQVAVHAPDQARRFVFLSGGVFSAELHERLVASGAPQLDKPIDVAELHRWIERVASVPPLAGARLPAPSTRSPPSRSAIDQV